MAEIKTTSLQILAFTLILAIVFAGNSVQTAQKTSRSQYVSGEKILDEYGREVFWRGAGGSYLFHTGDFMNAWESHLAEIQEMRLNTIRLAFSFPDSTRNPETGELDSDVLDFEKLDRVLAFLDENGIKAILDCHNYMDMRGDFGSQKLTDDWVKIAERYRGDSRIVAYEIFNEPLSITWAPNVTSKSDVVETYATITDAIRRIDSTHIIVWESEPFTTCLDEVTQYIRPNIVFTKHRWYHRDDYDLRLWNVTQVSYASIASMVETRRMIRAPFWLGEFGAYPPFNDTNLEFLLTEQELLRCQEQGIGWNLWMSRTSKNDPWNEYSSLFPLKNDGQNLTSTVWHSIETGLTKFVLAKRGLDEFGPCKISLWHYGDYVVFDGNLSIRIVETHNLPDGSLEYIDHGEIIVDRRLVIQNQEGTSAYLGDWNIFIYSRLSV